MRCFAAALAIVTTAFPAQGQESTSGAEATLPEVMVTAQKESQSLQRAAAALTVIRGEDLDAAGIGSLAALQDLVPAVRLQQESASTEVYIRGIGSTLDVPMIEPPTAFDINGIYVPRELSSGSLFDLHGVEVLPGPQGTLYGRGSLGGVINASLARPGDGTPGNALVEAGNHSLIHASGATDIPLVDAVVLRAAVNALYHAGYQQSGADSARNLAGRLSAVITPAAPLSIYLWSQVESRRGYAANLQAKGSFADARSQAYPHSDNPWNDTLTGPLAHDVAADFGPISAYPSEWVSHLYGAQVDWSSGNSVVTYIPSFMSLDWHQGYWLTEKPAVFGEEMGQWTQELRWSGTNGASRWLTGFYAYRLHTAGALTIDFPAGGLGGGLPSLWLDASDVRSHVLRGHAAFGQLTQSLAAATRIVAGARLSSDRRTADGYVPAPILGPAPSGAPVVIGPALSPVQCVFAPCSSFRNDHTWTHADGKLGIEQDLGSAVLLYATIQTAFQPGTFDTFPNSVTRPSRLMSYTAGFKATLAGGRLRLNDETYYYVYKDLLTQAFDAATGQQRLHTAQRVVIYGDQLDLAWRLDANTALTSAIAYTHARFADFSFPGSSSGSAALANFDGKQLQNAPDWTVNLGLSHSWPLSSGSTLDARAGTRFESGYWGDFAHSAGLYQSGHHKSTAALAYHFSDRRSTVTLWLDNIENKAVQGASAAAGASDPGPGSTFLEPPRTVALQWRRMF